MSIQEIRDQSSADLEKRMREISVEKVNLRIQSKSGQLEAPTRFKVLRKELARIKTVLSEKSAGNTFK